MADANPTPLWLTVLQLLLSWQVVVFAAFLFLRSSLVRIIKDKLLKVKAGPLELELTRSGQEQTVVLEDGKATSKSILEKATFIFREETVNQYEEYVRNESGYPAKPTDKEKYETLLKYSTTLYILKTFELIYNAIWGSQIQLIQYLNSVPAGDSGVLEYYFSHAKAEFPDAYKDYTIEDWAKFVVQFKLINRVGKDQIQITSIGIDFLKFIADARKSFNKPY